ncbi:MAG: ATP-dependent RecD-like DNA helicase, partial [Defluviitaleaceae bacterium]|nr:ATP-dependent RecD-like DNA helicase [Defluviitaleaceae bacterium]
MNDSISLYGSVENIIFHNEQNGYSVFEILIKPDEDGAIERLTCIGHAAALAIGEDVKCIGGYVVHPSYGRQFAADFVEKILPTALDGMEKYLAATIHGVGEARAAAIVKEFGAKTFEII